MGSPLEAVLGDQLVIELEPQPDEAAQIILVSGLVAYNESQVGPDPVKQYSNHLCLLGRNAAGMVKAGLQAVLIDAWLVIDLLWVAEDSRGQGAGTRLLEKTESIARERGAKWAILATFDYQAPDFYRRHGYVEYARMEDFPRGHTRFQMRKELA